MTDEVTVRASRTCGTCGVTDTHSHHIQYAAGKHPITGADMDLSISNHIQCCAQNGCAICSTDVEFAPSTAIGTAFTAYMGNKSDDHHLALLERHGVASAYTESLTEVK